MKITGILASAIALALLGSGTANAAVALPSDTPTNSSLIVTVFDAVTFESVTTDLGLYYNAFINNTVGPGTILAGAYTNLSFSLDMSAFADNNAANLRYNVYAGDSTGIVAQGRQGVIITSSSAAPTMTNSQLGPGVNVQGIQLITAINNAGGTTPFVSDYGDEFKWGNFIGGQFPSGSAAALGTALSFFAFATNGSGPDGFSTVSQFSNAQGAWEWNLVGNQLTYAPVPLPAAAWLLLSGIAGLGAFSRRRSTQA